MTQPFYDLAATRIELTMRDVDDPGHYGEKIRIAWLQVVNAGIEPTLVELRRGEALALAVAIRDGFGRPRPS